MFAFPALLVSAATDAGMPVPPDPNDFEDEKYPHFSVFCAVQLGRPMVPGEHFDNAKIISGLTNEEIRTVTLEGLIAKGLRIVT